MNIVNFHLYVKIYLRNKVTEMMILLERINLLRQQANGMTFKELEMAAGLSINTISSWGESTPSGDKIKKVANYFDVSVDYLVGNTNNPYSHKTPATVISSIASEITDAVIELNGATVATENARHKLENLLTSKNLEILIESHQDQTVLLEGEE